MPLTKITAAAMASNAVTSAAIANGEIVLADLATNSVGTSQLVAQAVTGDKVAVGTLTANLVAASTITGDKVALGTITGNLIALNTITGDDIAPGTLTGNLVAASTITSDKIASGVLPTTVANATTSTTFTAKQTFLGSANTIALVLQDAAENVNVSATAAAANINFNITTQSVLYYTSNATASWTLNFRGSDTDTLDSIMSNGQSVTVTFLASQGATAYFSSNARVDGVNVTPRWQGGSAPTAGNINGIDVYGYTIIKTGSNTYTLLASQTQFKA